MQQRQVGRGDLDAEVRQQVAAFGQREKQVTVAKLAQVTGHPQPVQPQRWIKAAGQHQLGRPGRPALDQVGHVLGGRSRGGMEVVNDDCRPRGQLHGIVGDRRGDIGRHGAVQREQVGSIGTESRCHHPQSFNKATPEAGRVGVGLTTRQPGSGTWRSRRRPARQKYALAGTGRPHHHGQPLAGPSRQPLVQQ